MKWSGRLKDSDKKIKGDIEVPNLSEENDIDEIDVRIISMIEYMECGGYSGISYLLSKDDLTLSPETKLIPFPIDSPEIPI